MKSRNWKSAPALVSLVFALMSVPAALAQCGMPQKGAKPANWQSQLGGARLQLADDDSPTIVGMWHVTFTATTQNGVGIPADQNGKYPVIDNALSVWHSDHTEIMNSVRPPQDGNFCLGVWKQTGRMKYYLNHFAWFSNLWPNGLPEGSVGMPVGPTHFTESLTLSRDGRHFTGTFTIDAVKSDGSPLVSFTGTISGTRITTETTMNELLQ
ncbi:MAG: hypothetical protein JST28_10550 [Acidobacteria bacterium]|nr:hypothetical protein [Acidobacteriota bacterium]